ncbi:MAG TPA: hypothetical protein RMH99_15700 [Sandaracinaceae bacterium LLY-WYZ-13_1]|nr:hypothetical protein [Sandaracinaceae bacterium LLY-WYZ-13_1]
MTDDPTPADDGKRRGRVLARGVAIGLAVAVLGAAAVLLVRLGPWIAGPDASEAEVARRWSAARERGSLDPPPRPPGPLAGLDAERVGGRGLELLTDGLADARDAEGTPEIPRLLDREVTPGLRRALARVEAWHVRGHGLAGPDCMRAVPSPLRVLFVVRLALLSAEAPDGDRMEATLALVRALQRRGNLVQASVGDILALEAALVFDARGWPATEALRAVRPRPAAFLSALARDAVCVESTLDDAIPRSDSVGFGWFRFDRPWDASEWPPLGLYHLERELTMYRAHYGALFEAAAAHDDDYGAMAAAMEPFEADPPHSVLVRAMSLGTASRARDAGRTAAAFDARLAALPETREGAEDAGGSDDAGPPEPSDDTEPSGAGEAPPGDPSGQPPGVSGSVRAD